MAVKKRLGEMLVEAGIIDETQLNAALGHQRQWGGRLGSILVELKLAGEEAIVDALALKFGFEIAQLDQLDPYAFEQAMALLPRDYVAKNHVFPLAADTGLLVVAMSDPTNLALTDELAFKTGRRIRVCIAGENAIAAAVRAHYGEDPAAQRESIALDVDDGTAVDPIYDPIGATSSEELDRFFQQSAAAPPAPPAAPSPPVRERPPAAARAPRSPPEIQLEDQKTESYSLQTEQPFDDLTAELQPLPPDPEAPLDPEALYESPVEPAPEEEWVEGPVRQRELTAEEAEILEALGRMAGGDDATATMVRPAQLLAALIRLLMRKQLITEQELLDEILRG